MSKKLKHPSKDNFSIYKFMLALKEIISENIYTNSREAEKIMIEGQGIDSITYRANIDIAIHDDQVRINLLNSLLGETLDLMNKRRNNVKRT